MIYLSEFRGNWTDMAGQLHNIWSKQLKVEVARVCDINIKYLILSRFGYKYVVSS